MPNNLLAIGIIIVNIVQSMIIMLGFAVLFNWVYMHEFDKRKWFIKYSTLFILEIILVFFLHLAAYVTMYAEALDVGYYCLYLSLAVIVIYYMNLMLDTLVQPVIATLLLITWYAYVINDMSNLTETVMLPLIDGVFLLIVHIKRQKIKTSFWLSLAGLLLVSTPLYIEYRRQISSMLFGWFVQYFALVVLFASLFFYGKVLNHMTEQNKDLRQKVRIDDLTDLYNFRAFTEDLETLFIKFDQTKQPYTIYTFDIDHFKMINDTYGHLMGNKILKAISDKLKIFLFDLPAEGDIYRTGGEEFVLIITTLIDNRVEAIKIAEEFSRAIRSIHMMDESKQVIKLTISVGGDKVKVDDANYLAAYQRADNYLYRSKVNGRNMITLDNELIPRKIDE